MFPSVAHPRAAVRGLERVLVPEPCERAALLDVDEPDGPFHRDDPARQRPPDAEMPRTPGDGVAGLGEP
jgi:hypothetical protein